jgi:hypothetical protein
LNLITDCEDCDPIARTPYHKNVAVRVEPATSAEARMMDEQEARLPLIA